MQKNVIPRLRASIKKDGLDPWGSTGAIRFFGETSTGGPGNNAALVTSACAGMPIAPQRYLRRESGTLSTLFRHMASNRQAPPAPSLRRSSVCNANDGTRSRKPSNTPSSANRRRLESNDLNAPDRRRSQSVFPSASAGHSGGNGFPTCDLNTVGSRG